MKMNVEEALRMIVSGGIVVPESGKKLVEVQALEDGGGEES
jgi:uncharacterized membrane protein